MTYRYLQGITYGPRDGTLGLSFHMSEGYDGLPQYLARRGSETIAQWKDRVNGVSCHVAILSTGEVWQMLDWNHASGNLNPDDRAGEYGYYGGSHLRAVLGSHWPDPNAWTLSAELAGFRTVGPTDAQVRSAVRWGREMKAMFPTIRGAIGHHDQSPKPCPGLTPNMRRIFDGVGGHGLWKEQAELPGLRVHTTGDFTGRIRINDAGASAVQLADREMKSLALGYETAAYATAELAETFTTPGGTEFPAGTDGYLVGLEAAFVFGHNADPLPAPPPDTSGDVNAAVDYITEGYVELGLRIEEARAR